MPNNCVRTVYIHAGLHKTGTSSIQATLAANKIFLEQNSVYYPTEMAINHSEFLIPMFEDSPSEYYLEKARGLPSEVIVKEYEKKKEALKNELSALDVNILVLSGEDISGMDEKALRRLKSFLKDIFPQASVQLVLCLREPADYLASALQQSIKTGFCSSRPYANKKIHFRILLEKFSGIFGLDNLVVYDFEVAKQHKQGLVGYFLEAVLGFHQTDILNVRILRDNDSVSDVAVNIFKYINELTESSTYAKGSDNGTLHYERYLNDTYPLWGLTGKKYKLDKNYVLQLYDDLEAELSWLRGTLHIDYNFSNASYIDKVYEIPETLFEESKKAFPKLSRIVRKAFYEYVLNEEKVRSEDEKRRLEQVRKWIEQHYKATAAISMADLKTVLNDEMQACKDFFVYFKIEGKQSYQLYYQLSHYLKRLGEHGAAKAMLQHHYEKNPYYNDAWEQCGWVTYKFRIKEVLKNIFRKKSFTSWLYESREAHQKFREVFGLHSCTEKELNSQVAAFLKHHRVELKRLTDAEL